MPDISVIIPCFNAEEYIVRCVEKLEEQTFKSFEIIIVDDCSNDNSVKLLEEVRDKSPADISIIKLEKNSGPGVARNVGIKNARGRYLAFCDIDDYYDPHFLELMYKACVKQNAEIMMCNSKLLFKDGTERFNSYTEIFDTFDDKEDYLALSRSSLCYLLVKKSLFDNITIPDLRNGEDIAVIPLLMLEATQIGHINEALYYYLVRENSASSNPTQKSFKDLLTCYSIISNSWKTGYRDALEFIGIKTVLYSAVLVGIKAKVDFKEIKKLIESYLTIYPKWYENRYLNTMSKRHKFFLQLVKYRAYPMLYLYTKLHAMLMR